MIKPFKTCLLIDDDPVSNFITSNVIYNNHFADNVVISEHPGEALALLKEGKVQPDVIFLDILMPNMDGFLFLDEYSKTAIDKSHTKIFVLSSSIRQVDIQRAEKNKYVSKFISKALTPELLLELADTV